MVVLENGVVCRDGPISYEPKLKTTSQLSPEAGNISSGPLGVWDFAVAVQQIHTDSWKNLAVQVVHNML